ncbi:Phox/Bem1p [Corchorus capsularis]|uniref:Phox/Bem1p n=1 Tax=Corchorus capsularis TaxID=210143 RepID=A0A1R3I7B9_COCAP|nr:Phox/Bem1p [Corchorus capsularis]
MEKNPNYVYTEHSRIDNQFNYVEHENGEFPPASQAFMVDPMGSLNMSVRPPELNGSEVKPVLNFSIQTGEEFALEFMRDRVNPVKPIIQNSMGESSYATTRYMDLKGILGISHTGSESGSDISMLNIVDKGPRGFERKDSLIEDQSNYGSLQSVPQASLGYGNNRGILGMSLGASGCTSSKMKVLCSFGGKILPRPSDGKLRYVGGETRIIRIRKDISWQELKQRILAIYDQVHVIKYQLPGEDFDALVSVSSDEDLQNMMEECNELEDKEASQRLRMFLFSLSDLEDAQFGMANVEGDSEIQYVVAVNGMDLGARRSSTLHGLTTSSANNLAESDGKTTERETSRFVQDPFVVSSSNIPGMAVSSSTFQSSQPVLPSSSSAYETHVQYYHGQTMQHPLQYGHSTSNYSYIAEFSDSVPPNGLLNQHRGLNEVQSYNGLQQHNPRMPEMELKPKLDGASRQDNVLEKLHPLEKDHPVSSQPHDEKVKKNIPLEEVPVAIASSDFPFLTSKTEAKNQENEKVMSYADAVNSGMVPKRGNDDNHSTSNGAFVKGHADSDSNQTDLSYLEPPVPPRKVYYSERIPREQLELLSRLSKSDDSLGSQLLLSHPQSGVAQPHAATETAENLCDSNMVPHTEVLGNVNHQTIDDGLAQLQKYKEFADSISEMNSKLSEEVLDTGLKQAVSNPVDNVQAAKRDRLHAPVHSEADLRTENSTKDDSKENHTIGISRADHGDILIDINDRFPRDFLSDIFSKAMLSEEPSGVSLLQTDGAGLSLNVENHEPKHWSYFQKLAQDYGEKDGSLINQEHQSDQLTTADAVPLSQAHSNQNFGEDNQKDNQSQVKISESMQFDAMIENLRMPESEYEKGKSEKRNIGLPPLDPSLGEIDINTLQLIKNEDLEELKELGSGTFGTVYHGKWRGSDVAIKRIKKICFTGRSSEQERLTLEFWREADILSKLHHPNVVAFYGVVQDGPGGTLATVTEYMVDGSLRHVLLRKDRYLDRRKKLIIAMDAAFGMEYLHSKNIVHFDLKCDNLLVNMKDPSRPICKVGDFGLSKIKRNTLVSGGVRGTLPWMAPELLNGSSNKVSEKVDVFSFGIVLWEILTGEEPYANMHYGAIIGGIVSNTLRPTIPSFCDPEWRKLMEQCWSPNPAARPSFTEIASQLRTMSAAASQAKVHGNKALK